MKSKFVEPRYLASFHPKRVPHAFADILIIGGGLAGLRAAIEAAPEQDVLVITKDVLQQSNSNYAQGGIAGVLDPNDAFEHHIEDTMIAGGPLCDKQVVEMVVREAPLRIRELIDWGTRFDEQAQGGLELGREGGHSRHRVVHALGDATGKEIMRAVIERIRSEPHIQIWERTFTLDLLTHEGSCVGALIAKPDGDRMLVWAKQTILCTGGAGQIYRETTNPAVATGDGHAAAYRAGAELRDLEFMQFHPTVLYIAGSSRSLITEAVRGEGAHLVDRRGQRFMKDYDQREELAPRDIVSQAIVTQMEKTRHPCVYLDMSHLGAEFVRTRFPGIYSACGKFGLDAGKDRIPIRPGAHYMIGGVSVDEKGQTSLPNLWAAGEVTSSGLHGANRLASNSLLEGLVYGAYAGQGASQAAAAMPDEFRVLPLSHSFAAPASNADGVAELDCADIRNSLKSLMWRCAGVRRSAADLKEAEESIKQWQQYVLPQPLNDAEGWELQNMLTVARIMVQAALQRKESRGVHLRTDFPNNDPSWQKHLCFQRPCPAE